MSTGIAPTTPAAVTTAIATVNVQDAVNAAVDAVYRRRIEAVAAAAVDKLLDDDTLAALRASADVAARLALEQPEAEPAPEPYYTDVAMFVSEHLAPMYRRSLSGQNTTWCPEWWRHAEAIARLEALWRAWEHLRLDPTTGMSVWLRDHLDHHMPILLSTDGPFKGCKPEAHGERLKPLPLTPPPAGLFDA